MNQYSIPKIAAVIGCGKNVPGKVGWGQGAAHAQSYLAAFPGVHLYGVDPNEENLNAFGVAHGLSEDRLFSSTSALYTELIPDMVSIVTWPSLHCDQVLEAAARGVKLIVCEKPMARDGSEIDRMLQACTRTGARLGVAHQRRYDPRYELLRELVQSGTAGDTPVLTARVIDGWDMLSWTTHWFDLANYIFDSRPASVLAAVDHSGQRRYGHAIENESVVFVEYPGGAQGIFVSGPPSPMGFSISVEGSKARLRPSETGVRIWTDSEVREIPAPGMEANRGRNYARFFLDLASEGECRCDADLAQWATRTAFAAHESAVTQKRIFLPSKTKFPPLEILQHPTEISSSKPLRIVALTDPHHWEEDVQRSGRDGLIEALCALGHDVHHVTLETRAPNSLDFEDRDILVIYHTQRQSTEKTRALVGEWIKGGRPTLVSHCGIGAWDWDDYRRWIGRHWVWRNEDPTNASGQVMAPCDIVIEPDSAHWSAPWHKGWLPTDEVYLRLRDVAPVEDIGWAVIDGERHPWAWRSIDLPNVGVLLPGHRADIWALPLMCSALASMLALVQKNCVTPAAPVE